MNSQSIYIGLVLVSPILNQKRYESVFNEILQYLTTHQSELIIQLHSGYSLTLEDKKFASIAWEIFNIIKENFPSKFFLSQENLETCKPQYIPLQPTEELRRQISCLMSIKEEERYLTLDEFEDAWYTLTFAEKVNDQRSLNICLELLNLQVNNWSQAKHVVELDTLQRIINKNDYTQLSSNKLLAQDLLDKVQQFQIKAEEMGETLTRNMDDSQYEETISLMSENTLNEGRKYDAQGYFFEKPCSTRMCLFQLSESNDINRVTMILQTLSLKSKETLSQLRKKYNFSTKLLNVLKKYCNAEYGFDQLSSRHGTFQHNLLKLFVILSQDYVVFLECLQSQTLEFLSQIIEEGIIYGYEDALSGANNTNNTTLSTKQFSTLTGGFNQDLFKFLKLSLEIIELAISKQYQEFLPSIRENLRKIQSRMVKLIQKKDNALLNYFILNYTDQNQDNSSQYQSKNEKLMTLQNDTNNSQTVNQMNQLSVDQLTELKSVSVQLYEFAIELNNKIQKVEALVDLQEEHEEKYSRLFYKLTGVKYNQSNIRPNDAQINSSNVLKDQDRNKQNLGRVQFDLKQKHEQKQSSHKDSYQDKRLEFNSNYDSTSTIQKENVFLNNEADYKRDNTKNQEKKISPLNNENKNHYIGSPIKPYKRATNENRIQNRQDYQNRQI